jgi:hypothetical protein
MTQSADLIAKVSAHPGLTYRQLAARCGIRPTNAAAMLLALCKDGTLTRKLVLCDDMVGRYGYWPGKGVPMPSGPGKLILKSRGFKGVDIDRIHRTR